MPNDRPTATPLALTDDDIARGKILAADIRNATYICKEHRSRLEAICAEAIARARIAERLRS